MTPPSCFLVDLDDTLFSELDYVDSGYRAIAPMLAAMCAVEATDALFLLRYELRKFGRVGAFDRVLDRFGVPRTRVSELVAAYRGHAPDIQLYLGVERGLKALRRVAPVAIVTDGNVEMQRRKVEALELAEMVDAIVFCWECDAPKPAAKSYEVAAKRLGCDLKLAVLIGDDPVHDMAAARAIGVRGIRVRTGRLADLDAQGTEESASFSAAAAALTDQ
jgi:putative hydrolase of the HAD superfamily